MSLSEEKLGKVCASKNSSQGFFFFLVFLGGSGKKRPWKNSENDDVKLFLTDRSHHKMAKENVKTFFWYYFMSELEEPRSTDLSFEQFGYG